MDDAQRLILQSRGDFPALKANGFSAEESRRIWRAFRQGIWRINECIADGTTMFCLKENGKSHEYEGYRPVAVDWTAFWRFKLKGWTGKMFHSLAGRALCGVGFGVICQVGRVDGSEFRCYVKSFAPTRKTEEATSKADTLRWVKHHLDEGEVAIADAGVEPVTCRRLAWGNM